MIHDSSSGRAAAGCSAYSTQSTNAAAIEPLTAARVIAVPASLPDIQATADFRCIRIDRVGVSALRHPLTVVGESGSTCATVGVFRMTVALPAEQKGTHMSRFLEVLAEHAVALSPDGMVHLTRAVRDRLDAPEAQVDVSFPYFIAKPAPVSGLVGMMDYEVSLRCVSSIADDDLTMEVGASATSLCPCSKLISEYGAHNQRCRITAAVRTHGALAIGDLTRTIESAASAEVYSVLKRPDEKFVTERAYEHPKFVEDIIRDLAGALDADQRVRWYRISSENFESIHSHNAYAEIERDKLAR